MAFSIWCRLFTQMDSSLSMMILNECMRDDIWVTSNEIYSWTKSAIQKILYKFKLFTIAWGFFSKTLLWVDCTSVIKIVHLCESWVEWGRIEINWFFYCIIFFGFYFDYIELSRIFCDFWIFLQYCKNTFERKNFEMASVAT